MGRYLKNRLGNHSNRRLRRGLPQGVGHHCRISETELSLRGYIIGAIVLISLLAATTALGAAIGAFFASFSDSDLGRPIGTVVGSIVGFLGGAGLCVAFIEFAFHFVQHRKKNEVSVKE